MNPVIIYNIPKFNKEKQLVALCRELKLSTRKLKAGDANVQLSFLAGAGRINTGRENKKMAADFKIPELIIFSGMTEDMLDMFLKRYKDMGIEPVKLKAVVTATNISWNVYELVTELIREHKELN